MMRTSTWFGMLWVATMLVATMSASCALSHERVGAPIGTPCEIDDECSSTVCGGVGGSRCTSMCEGDFDCTGGWRCATEAPDPLCVCTPSIEECNAIDDDCDGLVDETGSALCTTGLVCTSGACRCTDTTPRDTDDLDLLLMIDNSNSMDHEQASLALELPRLIRVLASGDLDDDGDVDFDPVESLHAGVVSSDMGVGGATVPTCDSSTFGAALGDDGVLLTRGRTVSAECMESYPAIFEFQRGASDPSAFVSELACVAVAGTGGCGFEQQLEAVLKAVSPAAPTSWTIPGYEPPVFVDRTRGHADRANAGFLRDDSVLAIVLLTDEEDCSALDPELFDPSSPTYVGTDLNLRCFMHPEATHPIERYVAGIEGRSGLLGLRRSPNRLVFGLVAGIPAEIAPAPGAAIDYDQILAHPLMAEVVDPAEPTHLRASCNVAGRGFAMPPRRMVRVAQELEARGARVALSSICAEGFGTITASLIDAVAEPLSLPECD